MLLDLGHIQQSPVRDAGCGIKGDVMRITHASQIPPDPNACRPPDEHKGEYLPTLALQKALSPSLSDTRAPPLF